MMIWMRYHMDGFSMFSHLTMMDLEFYMKTLGTKIENENKESSARNKLIDHLVYLRDILLSMDLPMN